MTEQEDWIVGYLENSKREAVEFVESQENVELREPLPYECLSVIGDEKSIEALLRSPYITDYEKDAEFKLLDRKV